MANFGMNRYSFIGRIGNVKTITDVKNPFISLSVAVDTSYTPKDGEKVEQTDWVSVTINGIAQEANLVVGRSILVEGRPVAEAYIDKEGKAQASLVVKGATVTYLDKKPDAVQ